MRAAVSGKAGTGPISRSAAGSPSAQTSIDNMHKKLASARLWGARKSDAAWVGVSMGAFLGWVAVVRAVVSARVSHPRLERQKQAGRVAGLA